MKNVVIGTLPLKDIQSLTLPISFIFGDQDMVSMLPNSLFLKAGIASLSFPAAITYR